MKPKKIIMLHSYVSDDIIDRFSSLIRAIRVIATCKRFIMQTQRAVLNMKENKTKKPNENINGKKKIMFTLDELEEAKRVIIKISQQLHFSREIDLLKSKK